MARRHLDGLSWRDWILSEWPHDAHRHHKAQMAVKALDEVLGQLAAMGFTLHVEEGPEDRFPGWPRTVYHIRLGTRVCQCQADLDELGEDWYTSMEEARYAAGLTKQRQRGGIFNKNLPAPQELVQPIPQNVPVTRLQSHRTYLRGQSPPNFPLPVVMPGTGVH